MNQALHRLAVEAGIVRTYTKLTGEAVEVPDEAIRGLLRAMGIACDDDRQVGESLDGFAPVGFGPLAVPDGVRCHVPDWLSRCPCRPTARRISFIAASLPGCSR